MLHPLYRALWLLLHFLVDIYETVRWLCLRIPAAIRGSYDLCRSRLTTEQQERGFLEQCKKQLTKLPHHLSLIIGPDSTDFDEDVLFRIIRYAFIMDIAYISLYDSRRMLGNSGDALTITSIEQIAKEQGLHVKELGDRHFCLSIGRSAKNGKVKNGDTNGHIATSTNKNLEIYDLISTDNRSHIVNVCRTLFAESRRRNNNTSPTGSEIPPNADKASSLQRSHISDLIQSEVSAMYGKMPEPELAIVFSPYTCTFGVMPWQLRFTEFHTFEPGLSLNAESFVTVLYRYSRCEQRWGK